jgi:hypothetical protein
MRNLLVLFGISISFQAYAQFTVAPFASAQVSSPPIGENKKSPCVNGKCSFEINLKPYCFGTNLRAFAERNQLRPSGEVAMTMKLTDPKASGKKDIIRVVFPSSLTYASEGIRMDCLFREDQNMKTSGYKDMDCQAPWLKNQSFHYKLAGWKASSNSNSYDDWTRYAARPLYADLIGSGDIDKKITCLYKFTSNNPKSSSLIHSKVSCYFPSQLPDYSSLVKIYKEGSELRSAKIFATTNEIKIQMQEPLNSLSNKVAVRHGKVLPVEAPHSSLSYIQDGGRSLTAIREQESFDETNANKSFSTVVKFPGSQGFCGGFYSPLMLFFERDYPKFDGVSFFPLYGVPEGGRVNWPEANSPGYFLVHLKEGESKVTNASHLFGQNEQFNNGFEALQVHDKNNDGVIDAKDPIFKELKLWNDIDSDGISRKTEIISLSDKKVKSIRLKYSTRNVSSFGSRARAREKAKFIYEDGEKLAEADIFDVWLSPID